MACFGTTGGLRRSRLSFGTIRGRETLVEHARALELGVARFERDLNDPALAEILARDRVQAQHLGVTGAPVFFINGRRVSGAQPFRNFKTLVDRELARVAAHG